MLNTAFVFPGQGSQSVGMLSDFIPQYPIIMDIFAEASAAVGYDVWQLIQNGPIETLNQTTHTQVAMLTADVAIAELLLQQGIPFPSIMAGHSLGEYAALVCAKAVTLHDAVQLVARRAQIMQDAVPMGQGAMAAIVGLTDEQVNQLCKDASDANQTVTSANYNAIGQVVVAGHTPAVERLLPMAEEAGARLAKIIPVSVPCHCTLLADAASVFAESLAKTDFKQPVVDVISNVDLSIYKSPQQIRELLAEQLYSPVRWVETIQLMQSRGVENILECGPGKVLNGLIKRIDRSLNVISVFDTISLDQVVDQLHLSV